VLSTVAEKPEEKKFARELAGELAGVAVSPARTLFFPEKKKAGKYSLEKLQFRPPSATKPRSRRLRSSAMLLHPSSMHGPWPAARAVHMFFGDLLGQRR